MKSDILADVKMFYRSRMDFNLILAVLIAVLAIMVSIGCIDRSPILILILSVGYLLWTCVSSLVYYIKIVKLQIHLNLVLVSLLVVVIISLLILRLLEFQDMDMEINKLLDQLLL